MTKHKQFEEYLFMILIIFLPLCEKIYFVIKLHISEV